MATDAMTDLLAARMKLRQAVMRAVAAEGGDFDVLFLAWKDVEKVAADLVKTRRAYDRHIKTVVDGLRAPA